MPQSSETPVALGLGPHGALTAIAIGAARADGSIVICEADRVEHTLRTLPLFRSQSTEALNALVERVVSMMRNGDARSVVRQAAEELPDYMRGTAFSIAVDVLLADGRLRDSEERFMEELRVLLHVRRSFAHRVFGVLQTKNFAWSPSAGVRADGNHQ
jgi:tellurite resistance protein